MQGFLDDLVGDVRPIKIARINMVYAGSDSFAQHGNGSVPVPRRPINPWAGQLHCPVAETIDGQVSAGKGESASQAGLGGWWVGGIVHVHHSFTFNLHRLLMLIKSSS